MVKVKGKKAVLVCDHCGEKLEFKLQSRSVAQELDACEQAHEEHGWGYTIGFFAMLVGHTVYCPKCSKRGK